MEHIVIIVDGIVDRIFVCQSADDFIKSRAKYLAPFTVVPIYRDLAVGDPGPGWTYDGETFAPPVSVEPDPLPPDPIALRLADLEAKVTVLQEKTAKIEVDAIAVIDEPKK